MTDRSKLRELLAATERRDRPYRRGDRVWVDPDPLFANYERLRSRLALCTHVGPEYVYVNYGYGQYRGFAVPPHLVRFARRVDADQEVIGTHAERYWTKNKS